MLDEDEEIVAVVYHEVDGTWYPHSIQARGPRREWVRGVPRTNQPRLPGYYAEHYDAAYSKADGTVYVHNSGSGGDGNEVHVAPYSEPEAMPGRIWLHPEAYLVTHREGATVPIDRSELAAMGYTLLDALLGDPFEDTCEGDTTWCEACEDDISDEDTFTCAVCQEYGHEHGVGQAFAVVDAEDAGLEAGPGLYKITHWPYYADGMVTGYLIKGAWERVGPLPDGVDVETEGYPCAKICDVCRDKLLTSTQTGTAA